MCVRKRPEKYFPLSAQRTELYGPGTQIFITDRHEYTHT